MKKILIIFLIIGFLIRYYQANTYPPLTWDEASLGYNAYSILKTARDEYGTILPIIFKSFGDFKPGLYVYLSVPFVALLGLTPLAVRLPSIIFGSLIPLLLFLIIQCFPFKQSRQLAFIAAVLCIFNPWNFLFSRGAWETNIFLFELLFASFLFFKKRYFFSSLIFSLTFVTYQSAKLLTILIVVTLLYSHFKELKKSLVAWLPAFALPLLVSIFIVIIGLFSQNSNRLQVLSLFSYPRSSVEKQLIISESSPLDYSIFFNHFIFFFRNAIGHYANYFSPQFLFFEGDWQNARHSAPYIGTLLYPSLVFLVIGLLSLPLIGNNTLNLLFLAWLILSPLPSALSRDTIHAARSLPLSIPLLYFSALGIVSLFSTTFFKKHQKPFILITTILYSISFIYYADLYFNHMVKKSPTDFLYGYHQAAAYVASQQKNFSNVYFSDFYGQPYIYFLFFSHYSPSAYQSQANLLVNSYDTGKVENIDNIHFQSINFSGLKTLPHSLIIISLEEVRRQNLFNAPNLIPLSPIGDSSTFYAYANP